MNDLPDRSEDPRSDLPRGLVFWSPDARPEHRRRRVVFGLLLAAAALALVWPIYPLVAGPFPLVLGLPFSLAWIVLWLTLVFVGLLGLYLGDRRSEPRGPAEGGR